MLRSETVTNTSASLPREQEISKISKVTQTDTLPSNGGQHLVEPPPYHVFTHTKKILIVSLATMAQLSSLLTISIYFPAVPRISDDLNISITRVNLTITVYMIFQGVSPVISGTLSDRFGRRPVYVASLLIYMISNVALAKQSTFVGILTLRMLQSAGCSALPILASTVVADMVPPAERGRYIGITGIPQIVGPSFSPVLGGALVQAWGWQAIFWFLACFAGLQLILVLVFLPETCRAIVGNGSCLPPRLQMSLVQNIQGRRAVGQARQGTTDVSEQENRRERKPLNLVRVFAEPYKVLTSPPALVLALYSSIFYAAQYSVTSSLSPETEKSFGLTPIQQGLMFLPMGMGGLAAWAVGAFVIDRNFARYAKRLTGDAEDTDAQHNLDFPYERARLDVGIPIYLVGCVVTVAYGWVLDKASSIPTICVLLVLLGLAAAAGSNCILILMSDTHRGRQGAASASLNFVKCPLGAAAVATVNPCIHAVGLGWTFTIFGGISALCIVLLAWDWWYGTAYRMR